MAKKKNVFKNIKEYYDYCKLKRYDTLGGTLSFFFLLSFIPLLYLCISLYIKIGTLISNYLEVETPIPDVLSEYISFDVNAAASVFFILTTIYSASKFFIQLKKTGEIIYGVKKPRTGINSIIVSCIFVIVCMLVVSAGLLSIALGKQYLTLAWQKILLQVGIYLIIGLMLFALICIIAKFGCQIDEIKVKQLMPGILVSLILSILLISLFSIYLSFTSYDALYGYFATVIVAAVFVFFLMKGMVIGIIVNEKRLHHLFVEGKDEGGMLDGVLSKFKKKDKKS